MAPGSTVEVEWQFNAPDPAGVERWLRERSSYGDFEVLVRGELRQHDTYYDTDDWRVFHAGYALRVRAHDESNETALKALATVKGGPARRLEIVETGDLEDALHSDGPVSTRLRILLGTREVRALVDVETVRTTWRIRMGGEDLAEIALDRTLMGRPGAATVTGSYVEIEERKAGGLDVLAPMIDALKVACGLTPTASKFELALASAGLRPQLPDLGPTDRSPDDRAVDRAYAVMRQQFAEFLGREGGTMLGDDPEHLHQMRVATRRMRAALQLFAPVLPDALVGLRDELRWFGRALGEVRDLDVQLEYLESLRAEAVPSDVADFTAIIKWFETRRELARAAVLEAFSDARYVALVQALEAQLQAGPPAESPARRSARLARQTIRKRYRQFRRDAQGIEPGASPEMYHALRIRGKRLRYSMEPFADIYPEPVAQALKPLRRLQDLLGEYQDLATIDEDLRGLVAADARDLSPEALLTVGGILEQHQRRSAEILEAYPRAVARVLDRARPLRETLEST